MMTVVGSSCMARVPEEQGGDSQFINFVVHPPLPGRVRDGKRATLCHEHRSPTMKILMVLTSHDKLGNTGRKTGFWLEEFAAPYYTFLDAGATVTLASPRGGQPPLDPVSDTPEGQTEFTRRFKQDPATQAVLANTLRLADVKASDYDALFYPGGHGPMWDLAEDPRSIALIETFYSSGKPVAAV